HSHSPRENGTRGVGIPVGGGARKKADPGHRRLLRARRGRPRDRRTADERDEVAPLHLRRHSITSSATASSAGENVKPRALAAFRFRTSSNLSSRITGRSAGLAPLRTFPV